MKSSLWTDVDGVLTADPGRSGGRTNSGDSRIVKPRSSLYFGAKSCIRKQLNPVVQAAIPVWIRNSFAPERPGTNDHAGRTQHWRRR